MKQIDSLIAWFLTHKAPLGSFFLGLAALVGGTATIYQRPDLLPHAAFLALVGTSLTGGGLMKSDQFYREKKEVMETLVDRRSPAQAIPPSDLQKLMADGGIKVVWTEEQRAARRAELSKQGLREGPPAPPPPRPRREGLDG